MAARRVAKSSADRHRSRVTARCVRLHTPFARGLRMGAAPSRLRAQVSTDWDPSVHADATCEVGGRGACSSPRAVRDRRPDLVHRSYAPRWIAGMVIPMDGTVSLQDAINREGRLGWVLHAGERELV